MLKRSLKDQSLLIKDSIKKYKTTILNDINLFLRIVNDQEVSYSTRMLKWEDQTIHFFAPISKGDFIIYAIGDILEVHCLTHSGVYHIDIKVTDKMRKESNLYYEGEIISPIMRKQQREYFRLSTLLQLKFSILEDAADLGDIATLPREEGISINISVGGMCILSEALLEAGTKLYIYLDFLSTPIELTGKVLTVEGKNELGKYTYRIQFIDLSKQVQDLINRLIFQKQRLERAITTNPLRK